MTALLQRLQSPACGVRVSAETCLAAMVGADVGGAMGALAAEIADHRKPNDTRHIAAIIVKNVLAGSYHHTGGVRKQHAPLTHLLPIYIILCPFHFWTSVTIILTTQIFGAHYFIHRRGFVQMRLS
jgi:hypothetical protein